MLNYRYVVLCPAEGSGGSRPSDKGRRGGGGGGGGGGGVWLCYLHK